MSDNLEELKASNKERIQRYANQGVRFEGLGNGYMMRMLEHLCGDALPEIQRVHELWTADLLDHQDKQTITDRLLGNLGKRN